MAAVDDQIVEQIRLIRAEHHACTASAVAQQLRLSKSWIVQRCEIMRALGLVAWTPLPGSLHVVPDEQLVGDHIDPAQEREPVVHVGAPTTVTVQFPRAPDYNVVTLGQLVTGDGGFVLLNDEQLQAMPMPERRKYYGNKGAWQRKQNRLSGPDASR